MNCAHNLYIHVPFCLSKCKYCAFYSFACANPDWKSYCDDICNEIKFWGQKIGKVQVPTIFFGGGTPSLMLIDVFHKIIQTIHDNFVVDENCEITLESNPGTIDAKKLSDFISFGVNRLSVGVQSLNDDELIFLGRIHNSETAVKLLKVAQDMGIRVSADFIYGLPNQNVQSIIDMCKKINALDLQHVSMYELTIEKNTPFGKMQLDMPNNDTMADMYNAILENISLPRYEVSNYATLGQECKHNQNVWAGDAYIGIGRGAAGRVFMDGQWYEQRGNFELFDKISDDTRATEKIITGLRTIRGVKLTDDVKKNINTDWIKKHNDLVVLSDEYMYTTTQGMLVLDDLTLDIIK